MAKQSLSSAQKANHDPLGFWEEISLLHGWIFERPLPTEMVINIEDFKCPLHLVVSWDNIEGYLDVLGVFDLSIPERKKLPAFEILSSLSVSMRLGAMVLCPSYERPIFRHSFFVPRKGQLTMDHMIEVVDEFLLAGEKLIDALNLVCTEGRSSQDAIFATFIDVLGEA